MTTTRKPELEDSDQPDISSVGGELAARLNQAGAVMHEGMLAAIQSSVTERRTLRLLVVDDSRIFLDAVVNAASSLKGDLKLEIETLRPQQVEDVSIYILEAFENRSAFDHVLLDFSYDHGKFDGLDILYTLRPNEKKKALAELETKVIHLFYLPVAIVTRGGSMLQNDLHFEEKALGAGADKVYSEKGLGSVKTEGRGAVLSSQPLLESLIKGGFNEMRFRAWARLWRDLREQMEEQIKDLLDQNKWMRDKDIEGALQDVWKALAKPIKEAGYATHLSMRILHPHKQASSKDGYLHKNNLKSQGWALHKVGSTDSDECPGVISWHAVPLLKQCLVEKQFVAHTVENLCQEHLINPHYENDSEIKYFRRYEGRNAMVVRIDTKVSPVGTFFITRKSGEPPFFNEDQIHLRIIVERLGLFYRELRMRQRNHRRQLALVRLGRELLEIDDENMIVAKAIKVLHMHLHRSRSIFTEKETDNPAITGRVTIRLIEPGTGRLKRPDQREWKLTPDRANIPRWALGFDTHKQPSNITVDSDDRYRPLIRDGEPLFFSNPQQSEVEPLRVKKTHAKMLAPIKAGPVVVGAVNVEHQRQSFYGQDEKASADFALLQGVALEVGQALRSLRARRMSSKLLALHTSTGEEEQEKVIAQLMSILYDYTGCAVGIWMEPGTGDWRIGGLWECPQGYSQSDPGPAEFATDHMKPTWRLEKWREHIMDSFDRTLMGKLVNKELEKAGHDPVFYQEEGFFDDESKMGIKTLSQATLALRDPATKELLGVFGLLFNQKPGLDEKRQKPLLEEAARFAASYLSIRRKNHQYLMNSQIIKQQTWLGIAYQQLRHSLRPQLGELNGSIDTLLMKLEDGALDRASIDGETEKLKRFLSYIAKNIDISRALMKVPEPSDLDLAPVWESVREQFSNPASKAGVTILPLKKSINVHADENVVKMAFTNLIDNAIEAMAESKMPRRIECLSLTSNIPNLVKIAVRDTGPGVRPEIIGKLFEGIGVSTKVCGSGFGTYFSALMLEQSDACIEYDRNWQQGAQFVLTFPSVLSAHRDVV
jgi:signal transduction histidine kinase